MYILTYMYMCMHAHCVTLPSPYAHHMYWLMNHIGTYSIVWILMFLIVFCDCMRLCTYLTWVVHMVVVYLYRTCMCGWLCLNVNVLGPTPTGVAVSPTGCQSLQVTWTHHAPTPPLTLNRYRVRYWPQGGSLWRATTSSEDSSYAITGLAPATTYTVVVDAQTQLGYGYYCCRPHVTARTHNGEASSDAYRGSQAAHGSLLHIVFVSCYRTGIQHACHAFVLYTYSEVHNHPFVTQCDFITWVLPTSQCIWGSKGVKLLTDCNVHNLFCTTITFLELI